MDLQDKLTGALIGLARATDGNEHLISDTSSAVILEGLFATLAKSDYDAAALEHLCARAEEEKRKMVPDCFTCASPCGRNNDYDMSRLWNADENIRSLKSLILFGIRGIASRAYHAAALGHHDRNVENFLYKALIVIGMDDYGMDDLLPIVLEVGEVNLRCMAMLGMTDETGRWDPEQVDEQGVCILLTRLHQGVRNVPLDAGLADFLSPDVQKLLLGQNLPTKK